MNDRLRSALVVLLLVVLTAGASFAQATKPQVKAGSAAAGNVVLKHTPGMTVQSLAGRSEHDQVELASGKRVSVGYMRTLQALSQAMRTPRSKNPGFTRLRQQGPQAFQVKPAAGGTRVAGAADLATALKTLPDKDSVQLPNGRLATMEQIRLVQPLVEQKLGRKIDVAPMRPKLTGPAITITAQTTKEEWKKILKSPDNTILQSAAGQRITVYDLKQYLISRTKNRPASAKPLVPAKVAQPPKGRPQ